MCRREILVRKSRIFQPTVSFVRLSCQLDHEIPLKLSITKVLCTYVSRYVNAHSLVTSLTRLPPNFSIFWMFGKTVDLEIATTSRFAFKNISPLLITRQLDARSSRLLDKITYGQPNVLSDLSVDAFEATIFFLKLISHH